MTVTLSICIPTYNRSGYLRECLSSVLTSVAGYEREIEIVISNNASTDDTEDIIRAFQEAYPFIRYHRNVKNIGGERNFYLLATLAYGENIWIFGDDDKMEVTAVARVLENIRAGHNLTICNYSKWDKKFTLQSKKIGLRGEKDQSFNDSNTLMKRFGLHLGYISSVIVNRSLFLKLPVEDYESFVEYGFPFLYAVYFGVTKGSFRAGFIVAPLICNRGDNSGNYDWTKYFVTGSSLIFCKLRSSGYAQSAVLAAKHQVLRDFVIPNILFMKLSGSAYGINFDLLFHHYWKNWLFWVACAPLFMVPSVLLRSTKNLFQIALRFRRA